MAGGKIQIAYRAPARKYKRKAYRKKGRARTYNMGSLNTQVCPQTLYVKLPWDYGIRTVTTVAAGESDLFIAANNLNPVGADVVGDFPNTSVGTGTPGSGQSLWTGLNAYAKLYDRMNILSNYTKIKFWNDSVGNTLTNVNLQVIMIALPFGSAATNTVALLPTSTLMSQKGAISRIISGAGGKNSCTLSMKRSTKHMIGCKDVIDRVGAACRLHQNLNVTGLDNPTNVEQWYYYIRVINNNPQQSEVSFTISSVANVMFSQRALLSSTVASTAAPPV